MALAPAQIVSTLTQGGLSKTAAAGVAGNAMQESSNNPGDAGGGLLQWQGDRYAALSSYAAKHGQPATSGQAALGYLLQDLNGPYAGLKAQLNKATTPAQAAQLFSNIYERPGTPMMANRIKYAQDAYGASGGGPLGPLVPTRAAPTIVPGARPVTQTIRGTTGGGLDQAAVAEAVLAKEAARPIGAGLSKSNPLADYASAAASGLYNTPIQHTTKTITTPGAAPGQALTPAAKVAIPGQAVQAAAKVGAPADAQKLLRMLHFVNGAGYSQGNHDAINQNEFAIKANGTDCSGLISWLMGPQGLGIWHASLATPSIASAPGMQAGKGRSVTVWNNKQAGNAGHVFIQVGDQFWASEGGGVGVHQLPLSEVQNYIAHGSDGGTYQALHPKGL